MAQTKLYLFIGYPGAGKTTIARQLAAATGAVHIWADGERHKRFPNPTHSLTESLQLYDQLNQETDKLLAASKSVVFDTNFNFYADRQKLRAIADSRGVETNIIWVTTPLGVAKERAVHSNVTRNGYGYVMTADQFNQIAAKLEPPHKDETVIKIDGTKLDPAALKQLLKV